MIFSQMMFHMEQPRASHICDTPSSGSLHVEVDVGREDGDDEEGDEVFSEFHFDGFLLAVLVALSATAALFAECVGDGYSTAVADVAVSHF